MLELKKKVGVFFKLKRWNLFPLFRCVTKAPNRLTQQESQIASKVKQKNARHQTSILCFFLPGLKMTQHFLICSVNSKVFPNSFICIDFKYAPPSPADSFDNNAIRPNWVSCTSVKNVKFLTSCKMPARPKQHCVKPNLSIAELQLLASTSRRLRPDLVQAKMYGKVGRNESMSDYWGL